MTLKCIKVFNKSLTIGKFYNIISKGHIGGIPVYFILSDLNIKCHVLRSCFESIEDTREKKLNQLLK